MESSVTQELRESFQLSNDYQYLKDDDDADESHYIYIINSILSGTARLNVLLPTATILAFTIFAPLLTNDGKCNSVSRWLMGSFLIVLAASCVSSTITDSFRTATGRLYYGIATLNGIWSFNAGRKKPCFLSDYKLRWSDLSMHGFLWLYIWPGSHRDDVACYYPGISRKVTNTVPLVVGFAVSVSFVVFPSSRGKLLGPLRL